MNDSFPANLVTPHLFYYPEYILAQHLLPFSIYRYPAYVIIPSTREFFAQKRKPYHWVASCVVVSQHLYLLRVHGIFPYLYLTSISKLPEYIGIPDIYSFRQWEMYLLKRVTPTAAGPLYDN